MNERPREAARAPLFVDSFALCEWLVGRLGDDPRVLARRTLARALDLLDAVTLALKDRDRAARLDEADEHLIALRVALRLAATTGLLDEAQLWFALEAADRIGRQLGGWRRALGGAA